MDANDVITVEGRIDAGTAARGSSLAFGGLGLLVAAVGLFGLSLVISLQAARPKLVFVWLSVPGELKYHGYSYAK